MRADDNSSEIKHDARPSPRWVLLWKEWRRQRLLFCVLASLAILSFFALVYKRKPFHAMEVSLLAWGTMVVLLGANTFAGEREDRSAEFGEALPWSLGKVFWVKFGVAATLALSVFAVLGSFVFFMCPEEIHFAGDEFAPIIALYLLLFVLLITGMVASFRAGVLTTFLVSVVVGSAVIGMIFGSLVFFARMLGNTSSFEAVTLAAFLVALIILGLMASYAWTRPITRWGKRMCRILTLVGFFFLIVFVLPVALYVRGIFMSPGEMVSAQDGQSLGIGRYSSVMAYPSPDGRYVALVCSLGWGKRSNSSRTAILDVFTGQAKWLDRFHVNNAVAYGWQTPWSPDGKWLAVWRGPLILPFEDFLRSDRAKRVLYSPQDDQWLPVPGDNNWAMQWCDGSVLVSNHDHDSVTFFDPATSKTWTLETPEAIREAHRRIRANEYSPLEALGGVVIAYFYWKDDKTPNNRVVECLRFKPDLLSPNTRSFNFTATAYPWGISPDASCVLVGVSDGPKVRTSYLCSIDEGWTRELPELPPFQSEFTSDGKILYVSGDQLVRYDIVSDTQTRFPVESVWDGAPPRHRGLDRLSASPSGRYVVLGRYVGDGLLTIQATVIDLSTGKQWPVWSSTDKKILLDWLDDETLTALTDDGLWTLSRDGTEKRKLLP